MERKTKGYPKRNGETFAARWREKQRDLIEMEQKSAPNVFVEQLTALSQDPRSLEEQETIPNRGALVGLIIPWRFFPSLTIFLVSSFGAPIVLYYQCFKRRFGKGFI
jgi:hypothetical protein